MILINLLPWRERLEEERRRRFFLAALICFGLSLSLVLAIKMWLYEQVRQQQKLNARLQSEIQQVGIKIATLRGLQEQRRQLVARMSIIQTLQDNRQQAVHIFNQLTPIVPNGIYLTSIKREADEITLTGKATSNMEISQFIRSIEATKQFTAAKLIEIITDTSSAAYATDFALHFKINSRGDVAQ
jgi:type IV pilus assembly protein PilN